jgi:hypothetical protein
MRFYRSGAASLLGEAPGPCAAALDSTLAVIAVLAAAGVTAGASSNPATLSQVA